MRKSYSMWSRTTFCAIQTQTFYIKSSAWTFLVCSQRDFGVWCLNDDMINWGKVKFQWKMLKAKCQQNNCHFCKKLSQNNLCLQILKLTFSSFSFCFFVNSFSFFSFGGFGGLGGFGGFLGLNFNLYQGSGNFPGFWADHLQHS